MFGCVKVLAFSGGLTSWAFVFAIETVNSVHLMNPLNFGLCLQTQTYKRLRIQRSLQAARAPSVLSVFVHLGVKQVKTRKSKENAPT